MAEPAYASTLGRDRLAAETATAGVIPGTHRPDGARDASRFLLSGRVCRGAEHLFPAEAASEPVQGQEDIHIGYRSAHTSCMVAFDHILPKKRKKEKKKKKRYQSEGN